MSYKIITFFKRWIGSKTFLYALGKENLGPKIGTCFAVYKIAEIILSSPSDLGAENASDNLKLLQVNALLKQLEIMSSNYLFIAIVVCAVLWTAAILCRASYMYWKIKTPWIFKLGQWGPYFGIAAQFCLGMLVVPFLLAWAIYLKSSEALNHEQFSQLLTLSISLVGLIVAMHFLAFIEKDLPNAVVYLIQTSPTMKLPGSRNIIEILDREHNGLVWVGDAESLLESKDGRIVVSLPILYSVKKWSNTEASQLDSMLRNAETAWLTAGCQVLYRLAPHDINAMLSGPMQKPPQSLPVTNLSSNPIKTTKPIPVRYSYRSGKRKHR